MKKWQAFVFDFDLTLADSSKAILSCYQQTLRKFRYPVPSDDAICATIGHPLTESVMMLTGIYRREAAEPLVKAYSALADQIMAKGTEFYPDTFLLLDALRRNGIKTGIVSTKYRRRIEETFRVHGHEMPANCLIGPEEVSRPKPDPEGLLKAASMLSVPPEQILYVGDSTVDAETAKNADIDFAAVTTGFTTAEAFADYPHLFIAGSLTALAEAAGIALTA